MHAQPGGRLADLRRAVSPRNRGRDPNDLEHAQRQPQQGRTELSQVLSRIDMRACGQQQREGRPRPVRASSGGVARGNSGREVCAPAGLLCADEPVELFAVDEEPLVEGANGVERRSANDEKGTGGSIDDAFRVVLPLEHPEAKGPPPARKTLREREALSDEVEHAWRPSATVLKASIGVL